MQLRGLTLLAIVFCVGTANAQYAFTTLATFNGDNGAYPFTGLIADNNGNLYGTTISGGPGTGGTIFEIAAGTHQLTTLASFDGTNGSQPRGTLLIDSNGNFYGTTYAGGAADMGTVFKLAAGAHTPITLVSFNGTNGANPTAGLIVGSQGKLYGTTGAGGPNNMGTVFKVDAGTNALETLATFNGANGANPATDLFADANGNLYGTTYVSQVNEGTIYKVAVGSNTLSTVFTFDYTHGTMPYAGLVADSKGNLYGTTTQGGHNIYNYGCNCLPCGGKKL